MSQTFIIAPRRMLEADLPTHAIDGELIITTDSGKLFQGQGPTTALKQVGGGALPTGSGNEVLASPADGSSAPVAPRVLVVADIPALPYDASGAASTAQSNAETFATSAVATEATARATADTTMQTNITAEATARVAADALKADLVGGVIPNAQLPPLAITVPFVVSSQAAMLALAASQGDVAIRTDVDQNFILMSGGNPTVLADWLELLTPAAPVQSVFGRAGTIAAESADYSAFYDASGAAATAQSNAETFATSAVATETTRAEAAEALAIPITALVDDTVATASIGKVVSVKTALAQTAVNGAYTTQYTIPIAGVYRIGGSVTVRTLSSTSWMVETAVNFSAGLKNGSLELGAANVETGGTQVFTIAELYFHAGDVIQTGTFAISGSNTSGVFDACWVIERLA
jgi:hypothetical protein